MKLTRRKVMVGAAWWAGGWAGAGALAACGVGAGGTQPPAARKAVTVQFWSRFGSSDPIEPVELKDLPVYMQQSAPIKVDRNVIADYNTLIDKLTVAFASGTGPDVVTLGSPGIAQFAGPGSLLALDKSARVKKEAEDFFGPPLNVGRYKDTLFGLTYYVDMRIALYRKDALAEAGLPADRKALAKTWDQFRDVTRQLARWEGGQLMRIGFGVPRADDTHFFTLVKQQGQDALNAAMTKAGFDATAGERALQFQVDLLQRDRVDSYAQRPSLPSGVEPLSTPLMASRWNNSQTIVGIQKAGLPAKDLVVTDFTPEYGGKTAATGYLGGTWVAANKDTKAPDESIDFLLYLAGLDHQLNVAQATTSTPARKSAEKSPLVQDPVLRPFYEALATAWSVPQHPKFQQIRVKITALQDAALKQEKSVKEAVADMIGQTNTLIAGT
jgi:multiple sugar transport system substrate-binding protein